MIRKGMLILGASLALAAQPASAQDEQSGEQQAMAAMAAMFAAEPLTAEQEARLPAARVLIDKIMPPGAMGEILGSMMDGFLDPLMKLAVEPTPAGVAQELGLEESDIDLSEEQAAEAAAILDPVWKERRQREISATNEATRTVMTAMEPAMRKGMAEAYAVAFTESELADIDAFFTTTSGAAYARKSYALASDPRIVGAVMESMPELMTQFAAMDANIKAATADVPQRREFDDLTAGQRQKLAELTGLSEAEIAEGLARAEEARSSRAATLAQ